MPRYKPPKITRGEAAAELQASYDEGYAAGLAGREHWGYSWSWHDGEWARLRWEQRDKGCRRGYQEFKYRVVRAVRTWPAPPAPPTEGGR